MRTQFEFILISIVVGLGTGVFWFHWGTRLVFAVLVWMLLNMARNVIAEIRRIKREYQREEMHKKFKYFDVY